MKGLTISLLRYLSPFKTYLRLLNHFLFYTVRAPPAKLTEVSLKKNRVKIIMKVG